MPPMCSSLPFSPFGLQRKPYTSERQLREFPQIRSRKIWQVFCFLPNLILNSMIGILVFFSGFLILLHDSFFIPQRRVLSPLWVPLVRLAIISLFYCFWNLTTLRTVVFIWWAGRVGTGGTGRIFHSKNFVN